MANRRINKNERFNFIKEIGKNLRGLDDFEFMYRDDLSEKMDLTPAQITHLIQIMKDFVCEDLTYAGLYPVSGKKGYALLQKSSDEDILKCYKSLYMWSKTCLRRIEPLKEYLVKNKHLDMNMYHKGYDAEFEAYVDSLHYDTEKEGKDNWF